MVFYSHHVHRNTSPGDFWAINSPILCLELSLTRCIYNVSTRSFRSSSHFFARIFSSPPPLSEPAVVLVMSLWSGRGREVRSIWHTPMSSLAGPHKVTLNSARHYRLVTMLREPRLTPANSRALRGPPRHLRRSLQCTGADVLFISSLMSPCIRKPPPSSNPTHSFSLVSESDPQAA